MSIPTIPDAPPVQQFDKIPLRSMGDDAVFEAACNDFWPRVKPFAEGLKATGEWVGTVYTAMGEAYQQTAQAAQTATEKAGEAVGSAQAAGEHAQTAQQAIALLGQGAIVNGAPDPNTAWPSERTAQELALKRGVNDTSFSRYDVASSTLTTASTITLDLAQVQTYVLNITDDLTFALANEQAANRAEPLIIHLYDADLPNRLINWFGNIVWNGGSAPAFEGTEGAVVLVWSGLKWLGSVGVDNA